MRGKKVLSLITRFNQCIRQHEIIHSCDYRTSRALCVWFLSEFFGCTKTIFPAISFIFIYSPFLMQILAQNQVLRKLADLAMEIEQECKGLECLMYWKEVYQYRQFSQCLIKHLRQVEKQTVKTLGLLNNKSKQTVLSVHVSLWWNKEMPIIQLLFSYRQLVVLATQLECTSFKMTVSNS